MLAKRLLAHGFLQHSLLDHRLLEHRLLAHHFLANLLLANRLQPNRLAGRSGLIKSGVTGTEKIVVIGRPPADFLTGVLLTSGVLTRRKFVSNKKTKNITLTTRIRSAEPGQNSQAFRT